jgi:addiction module HigA family antidote
VFDGERPRQFRGMDYEAAIVLLDALNVAKAISDLSPLNRIGLHKLQGQRREHESMRLPSHPGRLLKMELEARELSANRLAIALGVPSGRITDILNRRRSISADTAVRLGRYFGNGARFWIDMQSQYDIALVERERGKEIAARVRPADKAA